MKTQDLINQFKELGYKVAYPKTGLTTYFFYSDGTKVGYCQLDNFCFTLSSEYIPSKNFGTGSQYKKDLYELTKEDIEKSFNYVIYWSGQFGEIEPPKFYKDLEHFISKSWQELTVE